MLSSSSHLLRVPRLVVVVASPVQLDSYPTLPIFPHVPLASSPLCWSPNALTRISNEMPTANTTKSAVAGGKVGRLIRPIVTSFRLLRFM